MIFLDNSVKISCVYNSLLFDISSFKWMFYVYWWIDNEHKKPIIYDKIEVDGTKDKIETFFDNSKDTKDIKVLPFKIGQAFKFENISLHSIWKGH